MKANLPQPGDGVGFCRLWGSTPFFLLKSVCPLLEQVPTITDGTNLRLEPNSKTTHSHHLLWSCFHSTGFKVTPTSRNRFLMSTLIQWSRLIHVPVTSPSQVYQAPPSPADLFYALTSLSLPGYSRLPNNSSLPITFYSILAAEVICSCVLLNILFTNSLRILNMNPVYVDHTHSPLTLPTDSSQIHSLTLTSHSLFF